MTEIHDCHHEELIQKHSLQINELATRSDLRDQRIEEVLEEQKRIEEKIDNMNDNINKVILKSVNADSDLKDVMKEHYQSLDKRVTTLETDKKTTRYLLGLAIASLAVLDFALKYLFK